MRKFRTAAVLITAVGGIMAGGAFLAVGQASAAVSCPASIDGRFIGLGGSGGGTTGAFWDNTSLESFTDVDCTYTGEVWINGPSGLSRFLPFDRETYALTEL
jgi:hypothetical protein